MSADRGDATLPARAGDDTVASGADSVSPARPVTVRAGQADDYAELQRVDPKHFVVGKEIARGGMGRILAARDRRLGRPVAIKELLHDSPDLRARFEREARITAKLQHPAIVNILEAGEWPGGEPFYVMKFVTGESFDKAIDRCTTLDKRLGLLPNVIAVVDALAFAHSKQVIHRDLKPQNVLVGEFGETVVIDWGLAKELAEKDISGIAAPRTPEDDATVVGSVLGTPAYMPVEQARGDAVDARADVYSLGALLYHVLVGAPPYAGPTIDDTLQRVLDAEPVPVASRTEGVPRDLVTIVEKAMARDAADRYPTAAELAADLKKFQTGQLVGAHEYSAWQLLARWVRAHRTAIGVAGVSLVVLAAMGGLGLRRIFAEQRESERLGQIAERRRGQAEDLLAFMLGDLRAKLVPLGKLDVLKDVANKAVAYFDDKGEALSDDDLAKRAETQRQLGNVLLGQGDTAAARRVTEDAMTLARTLAEREPGRTDLSFGLSASHHQMGAVASATGDTKAALVEYRTEQAILVTLTKHDPANADWQRARSLNLKSIGRALVALGDSPAALSAFRESLALQTSLRDLVLVRLEIGETLFSLHDVAAALVEFRAARALVEQQLAKEPGSIEWQNVLARSHNRVGRALDSAEGTGDALVEFRAALTIYERLADRDPTDVLYQVNAGEAHAQIGELLRSRGDVDGATAEFRKALAISTALAARDHSNSDRARVAGLDHRRLGADLLERGDFTGSVTAYETALSIALEVLAKDADNAEKQRAVIEAREGLGDVHLAAGDAKRALSELEPALKMAEASSRKDATHGGKQRDTALLRMKIGGARAALGDVEGALGDYRAARATFEELVARSPSDTTSRFDLANILQVIGDSLLRQGKVAEALSELRSTSTLAAALVEAAPGNVDYLVSLSDAHGSIGDALVMQRDRRGANAAYKVAHAAMQKAVAAAPHRADIAEDAIALAKKAAGR